MFGLVIRDVDIECVAVYNIYDGEDFDVKRTYAFHGDSLRLTASGNITPTPRLHLGLDATFNVFVNSYIREDLPGT